MAHLICSNGRLLKWIICGAFSRVSIIFYLYGALDLFRQAPTYKNNLLRFQEYLITHYFLGIFDLFDQEITYAEYLIFPQTGDYSPYFFTPLLFTFLRRASSLHLFTLRAFFPLFSLCVHFNLAKNENLGKDKGQKGQGIPMSHKKGIHETSSHLPNSSRPALRPTRPLPTLPLSNIYPPWPPFSLLLDFLM